MKIVFSLSEIRKSIFRRCYCSHHVYIQISMGVNTLQQTDQHKLVDRMSIPTRTKPNVSSSLRCNFKLLPRELNKCRETRPAGFREGCCISLESLPRLKQPRIMVTLGQTFWRGVALPENYCSDTVIRDAASSFMKQPDSRGAPCGRSTIQIRSTCVDRNPTDS